MLDWQWLRCLFLCFRQRIFWNICFRYQKKTVTELLHLQIRMTTYHFGELLLCFLVWNIVYTISCTELDRFSSDIQHWCILGQRYIRIKYAATCSCELNTRCWVLYDSTLKVSLTYLSPVQHSIAREVLFSAVCVWLFVCQHDNSLTVRDIIMKFQGIILWWEGRPSSTRKLCYRKDDRAMRPIHGALKIFGTPWLRPRLLLTTFFMGFCSDPPYECSFKIWNP